MKRTASSRLCPGSDVHKQKKDQTYAYAPNGRSILKADEAEEAERSMRPRLGLDVGCDHDVRALSPAPARRLAAPPGAFAPPAQFHKGSVKAACAREDDLRTKLAAAEAASRDQAPTTADDAMQADEAATTSDGGDAMQTDGDDTAAAKLATSGCIEAVLQQVHPGTVLEDGALKHVAAILAAAGRALVTGAEKHADRLPMPPSSSVAAIAQSHGLWVSAAVDELMNGGDSELATHCKTEIAKYVKAAYPTSPARNDTKGTKPEDNPAFEARSIAELFPMKSTDEHGSDTVPATALAAAIEYVCAEVLELAGNRSKEFCGKDEPDGKETLVLLDDVAMAIKSDDELDAFFSLLGVARAPDAHLDQVVRFRNVLNEIANGEAPEDACAADVARIVAEQKQTISRVEQQSRCHVARARRHVVELESIASERKEIARETLKILEQHHKDAIENEKGPTQRASEVRDVAKRTRTSLLVTTVALAFRPLPPPSPSSTSSRDPGDHPRNR